MSPDEEISYKLLKKHLSSYELLVIKPNSLASPIPAQRKISFPDHFFCSIADYSRLLLTPQFYEAFKEYDYILIYQLDCLALSSDLLRFCEMGYDYIGAPLFHRYNKKPVFSRVGNGGLSLRNVPAFLNVLNSNRYQNQKVSFFGQFFSESIPDLKDYHLLNRWIKKVKILREVRSGVQDYLSHYFINEDLFYSDRARLFDPNFKIAPIEVALQFAFDKFPQYCFQNNNHQLPFGAHAWKKWDRAFWEQHINTKNLIKI